MADRVRPDARKTLATLEDEWKTCTRCDLGSQRDAVEGPFLFGRGASNGILFIGEGPGLEETEAKEPIAGSVGLLLQHTLTQLNFRDYYVTNLVACRSCAPKVTPDGSHVFRGKKPVFDDALPLPLQYRACLPRLQEQIYLIDPVVVVGLGAKTCEALLGGPSERGEPRVLLIPGAGVNPVITEKKQEWARKTKGRIETVNEQNMVRYYFLPTLRPLDVVKTQRDQSPTSLFQKFIQDIKKAVDVYLAYQELVFGAPTTRPTDSLPKEPKEED